MGSPTLFVRMAILTVVVGVLLALTVLGFLALGVLGISMAAPASLVLAVLIGVVLFVSLALAILLGPNPLNLFLISLGLFVVALIALGSPLGALFAVLGFLLLVVTVIALGSIALGAALIGLVFALFLLPFLLLALGLISAGILLMAISALGIAAVVLFILWLTLGMHRLPLPLLGLGGLTSMPALPIRILPDLVDTVLKLKDKDQQVERARHTLTNVFTLGANTPEVKTDSAHAFLYGTEEDKSRSLDKPEQFAMAWPTLDNVARNAAPLALPLTGSWSDALTNPDAGTMQFWPTLTKYYTAFGPIPLMKVTTADVTGPAGFSSLLGAHWTGAMDAMVAAGSLYVIDMRIFEAATVFPASVAPARFTPSTVTFLTRSVVNLRPAFTPILIRVSNGAATHHYVPGPAGSVAASTWLYALQAAKASLTCWGIWIGHVYRTHIVTAAMQMTMFQRLPLWHPVRQVLGRQSKYVIGFDVVLLIDWSFPPPTSMVTSIHYLKLTDTFATGRNFFDDDPGPTLSALRLTASEFSTPLVSASEIVDVPGFVARLRAAADPASTALLPLLPTLGPLLTATGVTGEQIHAALVADLNQQIMGTALATAFSGVALSQATTALRDSAIQGLLPAGEIPGLNRLMLQEAYRTELLRMDWNEYPAVRYVRWLFRIARKYVLAVVDANYADDASVANDGDLQSWIADSGNSARGNVRGLPSVTTTAALKDVLTSLIYRITAHGIARLLPIGHPGLSFMGNFPPCLEDSRLPDPDDPHGDAPNTPTPLTIGELLALMPKTGTIGEMLSFILGFVSTNPYEPFIPVPGNNTTGLPDLELAPFLGSSAVACNSALQTFRMDLRTFISFFLADQNVQNMPARMNFQATPAQVHNWELNIET